MAATIYKISCRDIKITECYVGSTEDYTQRCRGHKSACNNTNDKDHNLKVYKYIRANGGFENFIIDQIIDCEIEDRYDAELYYFKLFKATLNTKFPKRSRTEWYIDNRKQIREQQNQAHNCECGATYTQSHKARHIRSIKHQDYINSKL